MVMRMLKEVYNQSGRPIADGRAVSCSSGESVCGRGDEQLGPGHQPGSKAQGREVSGPQHGHGPKVCEGQVIGVKSSLFVGSGVGCQPQRHGPLDRRGEDQAARDHQPAKSRARSGVGGGRSWR